MLFILYQKKKIDTIGGERMAIDKKQIIISEIRYWKTNKLLPEHYCDFLITLYAQGEDPDEVAEKESSTLQIERRKLRSKQILILLISLLLAGVASVAMFVLTEYPTATLLVAAVLALIFLLLVSGKPSQRKVLHLSSTYRWRFFY